jgi:hypothetical protein
MKRNHLFLLAFLVSTLSLIACSGMPKSSGGGGGGNATLSVTLVANPLAPPPATSLLSFSVDVTGLELTPASGTPQNIALNASTYVVDLTKLQSDSAFLGTSATIPVGTYTSVTVGFSNPVLWFCTTSSQTTSGCVPGSVTKVTGGGTAAPITTSLTLAASQQTGLTISFNLANAITINSQGVPVINLAASNVLTAHSLPALSTSLPAGQLDFVEDVTGVVTAFNAAAQTVTVQTATRGSFTATAGTTTVFSPNCTSLNFTCVQQGQVASLDLALAANGTFSLLEYDPLASGAGDWIEGVVTTTPASTTQFQLVANDLVVPSTNSLIGSTASTLEGAPVQVTLVSPKAFTVDTKGLTVPVTTFGGTDASILLPGQTVAVHVTSFTAASGNTLAAANADTLILRFTRVAGSVSGVFPPATFRIQSLPPFFGLTVPVIVQLTTGSPGTNYDGVTGASGLTVGQTVSIRALYFGPATATPFSAAKVRLPNQGTVRIGKTLARPPLLRGRTPGSA